MEKRETENSARRFDLCVLFSSLFGFVCVDVRAMYRIQTLTFLILKNKRQTKWP